MASTVILPFNNNPSTISVKTSSYTVPAGKYAYLLNESPNIALNGTNLYQTITISSSISTASQQRLVGYGFKTAVYVASGTVNGGCPGGVTGGVAFGGSGTENTASPFYLKSYHVFCSAFGPNCGSASIPATFSNLGGELYAYTAAPGGANGGNMSATVYTMNHTPYGIWVPSGTVINSARFTIIEYNI